MLKFLLFAGNLFALYICVNTEVASLRISGGSDADIKDFPYQVSIRDTRFDFPHICSGSIYKSNVIITAANCIVKKPLSKLQVYYGSDKIDNDGKVVNVSAVLIHPDYSDLTRFNDIAILFLKTPIPEGPSSKPAEIATLDEIQALNLKATVTGWGCTGNKCFSSQLQSLDVTIIPNVICQKELGQLKNMICAISPKGSLGTCYGDNGNPLTINVNGSRKLIGVVSFIEPGSLCAGDKPTAYTKIPAFLDWIKSITPKLHCELD